MSCGISYWCRKKPPIIETNRVIEQSYTNLKANFSEEPATDADDDAEQRELLKAAAAMGKREDEEDAEHADPEDVDLAEEVCNIVLLWKCVQGMLPESNNTFLTN